MSENAKKGFDFQELMESVQNLDPNNYGSWPMPVKLVLAAIVFVVVIVLGYFLSITGDYNTLATHERKESELLSDFESKAFKAANLDQYRAQLTEMENMFGSLLDQLPKKTEVPGLLEDITHTGLGSGLEFDSIELGTEVEEEFYARLPIEITVLGDYHAFGSFVGGVAALPRIVTLGDFTIAPKRDAVTGLLEMTITANTYRYASGKKAADKGGKRGGKGGRK
jgi:type IV pilus assembly protein PilO